MNIKQINEETRQKQLAEEADRVLHSARVGWSKAVAIPVIASVLNDERILSDFPAAKYIHKIEAGNPYVRKDVKEDGGRKASPPMPKGAGGGVHFHADLNNLGNVSHYVFHAFVEVPNKTHGDCKAKYPFALAFDFRYTAPSVRGKVEQEPVYFQFPDTPPDGGIEQWISKLTETVYETWLNNQVDEEDTMLKVVKRCAAHFPVEFLGGRVCNSRGETIDV